MLQRRRAVQPAVAKPDPRHTAGVRALMGIGRFYAHAFHSLRIVSPCSLPRTGAAILVCNHTSGLDPVLIQAACPRLIVWMMAREYYDIAALRWGFEMIGAIPVERSGRDLSATRKALRALQAGRILGVFPEGRIETSRQLLPFETGVAMMAWRSGAAVYPSYLDGTQRGKEMSEVFAERQRATLTFGRPVGLNLAIKKPDLQAATGAIQAAVEALSRTAASMK